MTEPTELDRLIQSVTAREQALAMRRRKRSLCQVTALAGAFGAFIAALCAIAVIIIGGGMSVGGFVIMAFAVATGALGGWGFGRGASALLDGATEKP